MNPKIRQYATVAVAVSATLGSAGADSQTLADCAGISDNTARLACYDRVTSARRAPPPPAPAADAAPPPAPVRNPLPAAEPRTLAPHNAEAPAAPKAAAAPSDFGFETRRNESVDEIRTRYVGQFTGWSGRTLFRLENGQVWKQRESGRFTYRADNPEITIRRASFGSFRLYVEGLNRSVRVKRIK